MAVHDTQTLLVSWLALPFNMAAMQYKICPGGFVSSGNQIIYVPQAHGSLRHPMPFDIEFVTFFKHNRYVAENLVKTCYFIHLVDNLCDEFMCQFTTFRSFVLPGN